MSRTRVGTFVAVLFGAALMALPAFAADPPAQKTPKQVTVTGEIVDLACYLDHGARGMKHQQCALTCLKNGEPMGLLTSEGKVYLLMADHQNGVPFNDAKTDAALQVQVTGPVVEKAGITGLTVETVKKVS